jgi:hypothetical protein
MPHPTWACLAPASRTSAHLAMARQAIPHLA